MMHRNNWNIWMRWQPRIISVCQIFFLTHLEYVRSCLPISFHRRPSFQLSFSIYPGASFKCSLISSGSLRSFASKSPLGYLFFLFFPVIHYLSSVIFEFLRWFVQDSFSLIIIQSIRSFQSYRWFMKTFSSLRHVTSQSFSRRISSMQNPLLVINLIWWRISIQ